MRLTTSPQQRRLGRWAKSHAYMIAPKEQVYETENYVCVPPALYLTDAENTRWTLGHEYITPEAGAPRGHFMFSVLRDAVSTGEFASHIERRNGKVRIFTRAGWKVWTGKSFL